MKGAEIGRIMRRIVAAISPVRHPAAVRWCVYLLECGDGTLYAGITTDLVKRLAAHRAGKGARYTRGRGPLQLVHHEPARDRSAASRREHQLKQLSRREKLALLRRRAVLDTLQNAL